MRNLTLALLASLAMLMLAGCAASDPPSTSSASAASVASKKSCKAECLVCKYNADMACIDVDVEKGTPSYTYKDKTYYFCSDTCLKKFQKDPEKYINQK